MPPSGNPIHPVQSRFLEESVEQKKTGEAVCGVCAIVKKEISLDLISGGLKSRKSHVALIQPVFFFTFLSSD